MGQVADSLLAKIAAAGLTAEETAVLVLATGVTPDLGDDVEGFGRTPNRLEDLESQDKLGNFEIQDLYSSFNQAETLASSIVGGPLIGTFKS